MSCVPLPSVPSTYPQGHKDLFCHSSFAFLRMSYKWNPTTCRIVLHFLLLSKMHPGYVGVCLILQCVYDLQCISLESSRFSSLWRPSHTWLPLLCSPTFGASHQTGITPPLLVFHLQPLFTPLYLRFYCYDPDTSSDLFTSSQILCAYNDLLKLLPYDGIFIQNLKLKIQTKVWKRKVW